MKIDKLKHYLEIGNWKLEITNEQHAWSRYKIRPAFIIALIVFVISFTVYLFTLSPTVGLEDSGEFIAAVASLGITHPSGYPLYVVLGKLFTLLTPFGDIAWRVNLFSAFCGSVTISLLSLLLINILSSLFLRQPNKGGLIDGKNPPQPAQAWSSPKRSCAGEAERPAAQEAGTRIFSTSNPTAFISLIAASLSLFFAFSPVFWSQAVIAEVYTLNAALLAATLLLLWRYAQAPSRATLLLFSFIYGLSITNHQMMGLLAPIYLIFILAIDWKRSRLWTLPELGKAQARIALVQPSATSPSMVSRYIGTGAGEAERIPTLVGMTRVAQRAIRAICRVPQPEMRQPRRNRTIFLKIHLYNIHPYALALLLFFIGLSFYLFILFRAWYDPLVNWNHPDTLADFWRHISRKSYNDFATHVIEDAWKFKKIIYIYYFFADLFKQLNPIGALLSLCGFIMLWFRRRSYFFLTFGVFLSNSVLIIILRRLGYIVESEGIYSVYYIPSYLMAFLWAGIGIMALIERMRDYFFRRGLTLKPLLAALAMLLLLSLPYAQWISFVHATDRSDIWLTLDWGTELLQSLEPNAVLLLFTEQPAADSQVFTLAYLSLIKKIRPDVAIVDYGYLSSRLFHPVGTENTQIMKLPFPIARARLLNRIWKITRGLQRPVYTLYPVGTSLNGDLISRSNGIAYRIYPNLETAQRAHLALITPSIRNIGDDRFQSHLYYDDFISDILYARASALLEKGHQDASEQIFLDAYSLDATPLAANARDYLSHQERWLNNENPNVKIPMSNK
ncbi:MAG: DUF2723 domain-containing protein [Patescibacteria group bacterium]